jgi:hypothetical protein
LVLTVTVEHDVGSAVVWPDSIDLGSFELLDAVLMEPVRERDRVASTVRFALTAFELGDLEIPSFDVTVVGEDTASAAVLSTDAWTVTVASVGRDETGDIRDIRGPLRMSRNWLLLLPWMLVVGVVAVIGYWLYKRYMAGRVSIEDRLPASPPRPAHEVAYESLDRLAGAGLLEKGEIKAYHIEVSEIIRRYIEGRYRVDALEMATYEVLLGLEDGGVTLGTRNRFDRFLSDCDLVKFAKLRPGITACREMVPRARKIVDETKEEVVGGERDVAAAPAGTPASAASAAPAAVRGMEEGGE